MVKDQLLFIETPTVEQYLWAEQTELECHNIVQESGALFRSPKGQDAYARLLQEKAAERGMPEWIFTNTLRGQLLEEYIEAKGKNKRKIDADITETFSLLTEEDLTDPSAPERAKEAKGLFLDVEEHYEFYTGEHRPFSEVLAELKKKGLGKKAAPQFSDKPITEDEEEQLGAVLKLDLEPLIHAALVAYEIELERQRQYAFRALCAILYPMTQAYKTNGYKLGPLYARMAKRLLELGYNTSVDSDEADERIKANELEELRNDNLPVMPYFPWARRIMPGQGERGKLFDLQLFGKTSTPPGANYVFSEVFSNGYAKMYNTPMTNTLLSLSTKGKKADKRTGDLILKKNGLAFTVFDFEKATSPLSLNTKKLLDTGIAFFTSGSHGISADGTIDGTRILIPLKEYARSRGVNIDAEPKETPDEQEKEAKRAKNALDEFRKQINKQTKDLFALAAQWSEPGEKDKPQARIIETYNPVRGGYIELAFTQAFARHLYLSRTITLLPDNALLLPTENSYDIVRKLSLHYNMDNNRKKGTHEIISVKSLLKAASQIVSYEAMKATGNRDWKKRIKEPLESALNTAVTYGAIESWDYAIRHENPQWEARDYKEWEEEHIVFSMKEDEEAEERRARNAEKKAAAEERASKKKTGAKKTGEN